MAEYFYHIIQRLGSLKIEITYKDKEIIHNILSFYVLTRSVSVSLSAYWKSKALGLEVDNNLNRVSSLQM